MVGSRGDERPHRTQHHRPSPHLGRAASTAPLHASAGIRRSKAKAAALVAATAKGGPRWRAKARLLLLVLAKAKAALPASSASLAKHGCCSRGLYFKLLLARRPRHGCPRSPNKTRGDRQGSMFVLLVCVERSMRTAQP